MTAYEPYARNCQTQNYRSFPGPRAVSARSAPPARKASNTRHFPLLSTRCGRGAARAPLKLFVRLVGISVVRQFGKFREMSRFERFRDGVLLIEPFAQVNEPATFRAERPIFARKPFTHFLARWAANFEGFGHGAACPFLIAILILLNELRLSAFITSPATQPRWP